MKGIGSLEFLNDADMEIFLCIRLVWSILNVIT